VGASDPHRENAGLCERGEVAYEIWWTFGWSYDTAAFMARMVFSKTLESFRT